MSEVAVELGMAFWAGEWTVNPETNSLARGDVEHHIEPKAMQVLLSLALRPNHVVSKEELIAEVWPDTFVSDDALTRCISMLRRATEDDPQSPRFIQTVPKKGYRLIAAVSEIPQEVVSERVVHRLAPLKLEEVTAEGAAAFPGTDMEATGSRPWIAWGAIGACVLFGILLAGWSWERHGRPNSVQESFRTTSFTSGAGEQSEAAFSPDGTTIAYVYTSEEGKTPRIYLKRIGSEAARELTQDKEEQFSPAWSPDGRTIAYLSQSGGALGLSLADASGRSAPKRVFIPQQPTHWELGALAWSVDGRSLLFPDHQGSSAVSAIFRLDLATSKLDQVTTPPSGWDGDFSPRYSPDGKKLAFIRASESAVLDIYWINLADGKLHQLTQDRKDISGIAWRGDSKTVVFSSDRGGKYSLWEMSLTEKEPRRLPVGTEDAFGPAVGPLPGQLAYSQGTAVWSIDRVQGEGTGATVRSVFSSTEQDSAPAVSPDGKTVAFQSQRSGNQEIWTASATGEALRQLTYSNGPVTGSPSWSHHGDRIVFDSRPDGHSHIFSIAAAGGKAKQITFGDANDIIPRFSADDQAIYFRSNRGGRWQIWRVAIQGGAARPITSDDGIAQQQSADGKMLYYTRGGEPGLWSVPANGGPETKIFSQPAEGYWGYFEVLPEGILYLDVDHARSSLRLLDPVSKRSTLVASLERTPPAFQGLSATPNGKLILMTGERDAGQHITLVTNK